MGGRVFDGFWFMSVVTFAALGCGGTSTGERRGGGGGAAAATDAGGTQGAGAGAGGQGGRAGNAGAGAPNACSPGAQRCSGDYRETCTAEGTWSASDFACAANVGVDDQLGTYCVTKTNGTYRCWGGTALGALPPNHYVRVQLSSYGDNEPDRSALPVLGLTNDGRLVAVGMDLPAGLPPAVTFRATNMWGGLAVCPLLSDGTFLTIREPNPDAIEFEPIITHEGSFSRALCVWEGLAVGIHSDGSLWSRYPLEVPPGNDWVEIAHSIGILCGIKTSGEVACGTSLLCHSTIMSDYEVCQPPVFPAGHYRMIAATGASVCALDEQGALFCKRLDGEDMPIPSGPYSAIEGGRDVLCAVRTDGSVTCFRHGGDGWPETIGSFVPEPALDPGW